MPPSLALLLGVILVTYALVTERKRGLVAPGELFWPTLWYMVVSSSPFGIWMYRWGIPLPGGSGGGATDGSVIDRWFYLVLMFAGFRILAARRFSWGQTLRANPWMTALFLFMAASILWSDYSFVSLKRYVKVFGSVVMVLVVLTNERPFDAATSVLRRCLYIHLPMSIICVKYYRNIGVEHSWEGQQMWSGITTSKNVLGQVAMIGTLYFFWELRRRWKDYGWRNLHLLYLGMAVFLLKGAPASISMTSVSVCVYALLIFLRMQSLRDRPEAVRPFLMRVFYPTVGLVVFVLVHSVVMFSSDSFFGTIIEKFGRNITLTDRTYIWHDVYAMVSRNPLFGVGYGGFWIGRIANIPWNMYMSWELGQAHNGYIDTYLQIGLVGGALLVGVIFTAIPGIMRTIHDDFDFVCFRVTLFLTILFTNITESSFLRGDHHLWFILMLALWTVPPEAMAGRIPSSQPAGQPEVEPAEGWRESAGAMGAAEAGVDHGPGGSDNRPHPEFAGDGG